MALVACAQVFFFFFSCFNHFTGLNRFILCGLGWAAQPQGLGMVLLYLDNGYFYSFFFKRLATWNEYMIVYYSVTQDGIDGQEFT